MTDLRTRLEAAIEAAIDAGLDPDEAIAVLDAIDDDPDLEDIDREPETDEPADLPPLGDGGPAWSWLGRLEVWDRCPCCGHQERDGHVLPVADFGF